MSYDYSSVNRDAVARLSKWYSGDVHDVMDKFGAYGWLEGLSLQTVLGNNHVICGPAHTVRYERSTRVGQPQDVYHGVIDRCTPGGVIVVDAIATEAAGTGELMSTGAKMHGALATVVHGNVRDVAEVTGLGYPLFARGKSPVGVSGRMEPVEGQVDLMIQGVRIRPGDLILADINGVVVIPHEIAGAVADAADANGKAEVACRTRILAGEALQKVWPVGSEGPV